MPLLHPFCDLWLIPSADEIVRLVSSEAELQAKIKLLEVDLQVYKRVFSDTNAEKKHLEEENQQLKKSEKQKETWKSMRRCENNYHSIPSTSIPGRLLESQSC